MSNMLYLLLLIGLISCKANSVTVNSITNTVWQIDFQDHFDRDTASLTINGCSIFKNIVLTSTQSIGVTDMIVKVGEPNNGKNIITFAGKSVTCDTQSKEIILTILFNGDEIKYYIDLNKGKYIGLSKKSRTELSLVQSLSPFIYD